MEPADDYAVLKGWLTERGHTAEEIEKIMIRVGQYERETQADSLMDSIGAGRVNLERLIDEALGQ